MTTATDKSETKFSHHVWIGPVAAVVLSVVMLSGVQASVPAIVLLSLLSATVTHFIVKKVLASDTGSEVDLSAQTAPEAPVSSYDKIRAEIFELSTLASTQTATFQRVIFDFEVTVLPLLYAIQADELVRKRTEMFMGRTLPRLNEAVKAFVHVTTYQKDPVKNASLEAEMQTAFLEASAQVQHLIENAESNKRDDLELALDVLDSSFAYTKKA